MLFLILSKSPKLAVLLSLMVPGGGQFYNESYVKGVIFFAIESYLYYNTFEFYSSYKENQRLFNETRIDSFRVKREIALTNLYEFLWWDALTGLLSVLDAYIGAHLYNFEADFKVKQSRLDLGIKYRF